MPVVVTSVSGSVEVVAAAAVGVVAVVEAVVVVAMVQGFLQGLVHVCLGVLVDCDTAVDGHTSVEQSEKEDNC